MPHKTTVIIVWAILAGFFCSNSPGMFADSKTNSSAALEKAIFDQDWKEVARLCATDNHGIPSPVLRVLKGHALLALNKNNESLLLFLSISNDTARRAWSLWTESFKQKNPQRSAPYYFLGDALARRCAWDSAIDHFNKALQLGFDSSLCLNARGVAHSYKQQWDAALQDFEEACLIDPQFADAHASLGTLLILKRAEDSYEAFDSAIRISPEFAMAYNGRACAEYSLVKWEQANQDFATAGRKLALPLFLANIRNLALAAERAQMPGLENSPLFRATDFLDWDSLRLATRNPNDILRTFLGGKQLPDSPNLEIISEMNRALENIHFYEQMRDKFAMVAPQESLISITNEAAAIKNKEFVTLPLQEQNRILMLNRKLIEMSYPSLIAQHDLRDPGMQLTLTQGLVDQMMHRSTLTPGQIASGQWRIDHLWQPMADGLQHSGMPVLGFIGAQWNRHLNGATQTNGIALKNNWGIDLNRVRPRGVLADLRRAHVDNGNWPLVNWFGLAYVLH